MATPSAAALITLLTVVLISVASYFVGRARAKYNIVAPATTGNVDFERAFRAHQNTIESSVMFLPSLWIASSFGNAQWAAWLGYAWLLGRAWYLFGYIRPGGKRGPGFTIGALCNLALLLLGFWALLGPMLHLG